MLRPSSEKAFDSLMEDLDSLSLIEVRLLLLITNMIMIFEKQDKEMKELSDFASEYSPLLEAELTRRTQKTPGNV